ncbi:MAG: glycosyltransferase [Planctomycetota bacterium]
MWVSRHYWPHASHDAVGALRQIASGLARNDIHVEVVTPKHNAGWSDEYRLDDVIVRRPLVVPRRDWTIQRYGRALTQWLVKHGGSFDLIAADSMREEGAAVVEAAKALGCGSLVVDSGCGRNGDQAWGAQNRVHKKRWDSATDADRILTRSSINHRNLISAGVAADKVVRLPIGFDSVKSVSADEKWRIRSSLTDANLDLATEPLTPVVLCITRFRDCASLAPLLDNAYWFFARFRKAKIWIIGDGPARDLIHTELKSTGVREGVAIPGTFANLHDVYAAADVFLQLNDSGLDYFLPKAVAHHLPIIASDEPLIRQLLAPPHQQDIAGMNEAIGWFEGQGVASDDSRNQSFRAAMKSHFGRRLNDNGEAIPPNTEAERNNDFHRLLVRSSPMQKSVTTLMQTIDEICHRHPKQSYNVPSNNQSSGRADDEKMDSHRDSTGGTA